MKNSVLLFLVSFFFFSNWEIEGQSKINTASVSKGVKSIKEHTIYEVDQRHYETSELNRDSIFSNNIGTYTIYDVNGRPKFRYRYFPKINDKGEIIEWGSIKDRIEWTYNSRGLERKHVKYYEDNSIHSLSESSYSDTDYLIKKEFYSGERKVIIYTYDYDKKGNLIKMIETSLVRDKRSITHYKYDISGNLIEEILYILGTNEVEVSEEYISSRMKYSYDEVGDLISEIIYRGNILKYKKNIKYHYSINDLIETEIHTILNSDSNEHIEVFEYEYDDRDNWITRSHIKDGIIKTITERELEYY
ncbi:hypothetical protein [uncultured Winogradskyella sp.]|uniref:hypothetical protein n=1 Tax=uncultured Winogradskyella sp. TaxID=395353 RepID=UPI0026213D17|nr:hypothetical protein [uncultured Winogradskyella sp.]